MPRIDGKNRTWAGLGKDLDLSPQGAKSRYEDFVKNYPKEQISMHLLSTPISLSPRGKKALLERERALAARERDAKIVRFALMHGPTHCAGEFGIPVETVKQMLQTYKF